jgi:hypothetical protein
MERPARRGESLSEVRASSWASAPGLFRVRRRSCIPAAFGIENSLLHPRLDNIGATLGHHEVILHSHIFIIVGIGRFRARGVGPGTRHQLLGGRGRVRQIREHGSTIARRTLRGRSKTNSVRQQSCFPRWHLHCGRHRTGGHQPQSRSPMRPYCEPAQGHRGRPIL